MSLTRLDFLRTDPVSPSGATLLLLGSLALLFGLYMAHEWEAQALADLILQRRLAAAHQAQAQPQSKPVLTLSQQRWQLAQPELRRPWLSTLQTIEAASQPPNYLLSLTLDAGNGEIKLEAESPSLADALAYVQMLDNETLGPALLSTHAPSTDAANPLATGPGHNTPWVHFKVTTHWRNP